MTHKIIKNDNYLLIVDDSEIKMDDYYLDDTDSIRVAITEAESYWTHRKKYKKLIAHLPLNGSPILEGVPLLPPIEDDVTKLAIDCYTEGGKYGLADDTGYREIPYFIAGYNKAKEKYKYTEEDMRKAYQKGKFGGKIESYYEFDEFIQSLHQYPTEFETEDVLTPSQIFYPNDVPYSSPKTITTTQGIQWVGKYK